MPKRTKKIKKQCTNNVSTTSKCKKEKSLQAPVADSLIALMGIDPAASEEDRTLFYCSTCKEYFTSETVCKLDAGSGRYAMLCPECKKSFGFFDKVAIEKIASLIKNNPVK